jgi:hypothetical protein
MPYQPTFASVAFRPEETAVMAQAFELALAQLSQDPPPVLQECMARRIVEAARNGERDLRRLRDAALDAPPILPG